jgi:hypothetical protein
VSAGFLSSVDDLVAVLVALEPRVYSADECVAIVERLARLEKACAAARAGTAARAAECNAHRAKGFANPADWLASATGVSTAQADRELSVATGVEALPATQEAVKAGRLSLAQAHEVVTTVAGCPEAEEEMLALAEKSCLRRLKHEGRRRRLAALAPESLHERQRAARYHRHWRDELGMIRYTGAMMPEDGVPFMNRLDVETDRQWRAARRDGRFEPHEQLAADAFARMVSGEGKGHAVRADVVYVCNLDTGHAHVAGGGPVPMAVFDDAARDGFVKAVMHDGTKIDTVVHYGRHGLPAVVRTAIELGDPPEFDGIRCTDCDAELGLQWDHADPVANGGPTTRNNLKPRCYRCHVEKTERDRQAGLLGGGGSRGQPP